MSENRHYECPRCGNISYCGNNDSNRIGDNIKMSGIECLIWFVLLPIVAVTFVGGFALLVVLRP